MIFRETQIKTNYKGTHKYIKGGTHLFIFVHGYKGSPYDLRLWRNELKMKFIDKPVLMFSPESNVGVKGNDDIFE